MHKEHGAAEMKPSVSISAPFARATTPRAKVGVAFLVLESTHRDAVLVGGSTDVAEEVQLHTVTSDDGIMRMRRLDSIALPLGEPVHLEPGGMHVMLIGLKDPLKEGATFRLNLEFQDADPLSVDVPVKGIAARAEEMDHSNEHGSHGH